MTQNEQNTQVFEFSRDEIRYQIKTASEIFKLLIDKFSSPANNELSKKELLQMFETLNYILAAFIFGHFKNESYITILELSVNSIKTKIETLEKSDIEI